MTPLRITAHLWGEVVLPPQGGLALDALLAWRVANDLELPPPRSADECTRVDIPIALEPGGRFHLCSFSQSEAELSALRYVNRRAPVEQYQTIGSTKIRRVLLKGGVDKSYRIPMPTAHLRGDVVTWWCIGDAEEIRALLAGIGYLGKRRAVGRGRVVRWDVEPCEPWDGFPVVRDGRPLRNLPRDWPGLTNAPMAYRVLTFPYWDRSREEVCACPE